MSMGRHDVSLLLIGKISEVLLTTSISTTMMLSSGETVPQSRYPSKMSLAECLMIFPNMSGTNLLKQQTPGARISVVPLRNLLVKRMSTNAGRGATAAKKGEIRGLKRKVMFLLESWLC